MDYKDKYIKYKTKYLELKNVENQVGGSKKILFILFPGHGCNKKIWDVFLRKTKKLKPTLLKN